MPRAAVPPMTADPSRPLYPRTQFAAGGQYGSTPRVHVGDTSQPSSGNNKYRGDNSKIHVREITPNCFSFTLRNVRCFPFDNSKAQGFKDFKIKVSGDHILCIIPWKF